MPSAKAAEMIAASLHRLYGSEVEVQYYDAGDPKVAEAHQALLEELATERVPLPAVLLDGDLLYAGSINPLRVVAAVAAVRQKSEVRSQ